MKTWVVYDLDVWGNEEDGYEVNDWWAVGELSFTDMEIQDDKVILEKMKKSGYLATSDMRKLEVVADYGFIEIVERKTGKYLYNLELKKEGK